MRWCLYASILGTLVSGILLGSNDENKTGLQLGRARQLSTRSFTYDPEVKQQTYPCQNDDSLNVRLGESMYLECNSKISDECKDGGWSKQSCLDALTEAYANVEYANLSPVEQTPQRQVHPETCNVVCRGSDQAKNRCVKKCEQEEHKNQQTQYWGLATDNGVKIAAQNGYPFPMSHPDCAALANQLGEGHMVESDAVVGLPGGETSVPPTLEDLRNLDWLDGLRDQQYNPIAPAGANITIYVLDTGVNCWHRELAGRCVKIYDVFYARRESHRNCRSDSKRCAHDKNGHGSHVAATAAGLSTGVAPRATIGAIKVLTDSGIGSNAGVLAGMDHAVHNCAQTRGNGPGCVMSMSLVGSGRSRIFERAIDVALENDVLTVVAAGNDNRNACNYSPAFVNNAITVASAEDTGSDTRVTKSSFSNTGPCIDIWAIGSNVVSARHLTKETYASKSGTSMSTPAVAGAAALVLSAGNVRPVDMATLLGIAALPNAILQCPRDTNNFLLRLASR